VVEEAPAPGMDEATREAICGAAVRAAKAVDYVGAGTVEFIADASEGLSAERIFFMEMNTRLQVEHPVTEAITGVDLVEWQLRVASGETLPLRQEELSINGHAMEARLYAEDPARGFLPSPGRVDHLALDHRIRVETGVEEGDSVSAFYDPLIAKLVVHAGDREEARQAMLQALDASYVAQVRTNQAFLYACFALEEFAAAELDTGLIERKGETLLPAEQPSQTAIDAAARRYRRDYLDWSGPFSPQGRLSAALFGFRLNAAPAEKITLYAGDKAVCGNTSGHRRAHGPCTTMTPEGQVLVTERGQTFLFNVRGPDGARSASAHDGGIIAPMPGRVIAVHVAEGDAVEAGQRLLVLEAMKMEHALTAPFAGRVAELAVSVGAQVQVEAVMARIEPSGGEQERPTLKG